ncbi:hypothetical protein Salat_2765600 [Sesamum alatum]|uniref:DUF4228 domain protein n=1 Tax=Sesamum alatum TaxID=300844 RepID=A0AAE1XKB9_9LAMI|nr:hypothetical protein Salat_2765600 [Sesamum alatum]
MGMSRKINQMMTASFPRCFHGISCVHIPPEDGTNGGRRRRRRQAAMIKLIKSDGGVKIYDRPIKAWELMEEFPKHLVCRSDCFYIGQKTPALSHHDRLQPGQNYFLLPANFFQSALSFTTLTRCRSAFARRHPFEFEKTPAGSLRIKVTDEMIIRHQEEEELEAAAAQKMIRVCSTPQLRKEYEQLVGRRRHWKPRLDTIVEKKSSHQKKKTRKKKSSTAL